MLGLLVFPHRLIGVALPGLALAFILVFLSRPAAVWVSTAFQSFTTKDRILLGWAGLRGAVPIVLATFALSDSVRGADTIFNAVFFVVLVSAILQGTTLERVATRLDLVDPIRPMREHPLEVPPESELDLVDFVVAPDHAIAGSAVREIGLPRTALIAVVLRNGQSIPPRGSTEIEPGDRLYVLSPRSMRSAVEDAFSRWRRRV